MRAAAGAPGEGGPALPPAETSTLGDEIYRLVADIFPICRSVAGEGVRETLRRLQREDVV